MAKRNSPLLPFALIIMDGYGNNPNPKANAVFHAKKPTLEALFKTYAYTEIATSGLRVGLPDGQMGNSEVGHLNIGGGRVVKQELTRISEVISENRLGENEALKRCIDIIGSRPGSALHMIGLVSHGGVHSSLEHLEALVKTVLEHGVKHVIIHAITDGRDRPPHAAKDEIAEFEKYLNELNQKFSSSRVVIANIVGRYFAMDRDKRWERTKKAYDLFTLGQGEIYPNVETALAICGKEKGIGDEFLEPIVVTNHNFGRATTICEGDGILFFNFRTDRMRQIVQAFLPEVNRPAFNSFPRDKVFRDLALCALTEYEAHFGIDVLFPPTIVKNHLGEVIAAAGRSQLRIAETEKYPHVTYFFNGGVEEASEGEERILIPSPRDVATYDLKPEMSAYEVTDRLIERLGHGKLDHVILNFANCDMVGHTGSFQAAVKAVETTDKCVGKVLECLLNLGGGAIVTADHGNAEQMVDYVTGEPHTFHTTNPVPLIVVDKAFPQRTLRAGGALCDIAPTICDLTGLTVPPEMTGRSLLENS